MFNKLYFQLPQNVTLTDQIRQVIRTSTGTNGVGPSNLLCEHDVAQVKPYPSPFMDTATRRLRTVTYPFIALFEHLKNVSKKSFDNFYS